MWFSRAKTVKELGLLDGLVDTHSHLLWGVDDGATSAEASDRMVTELKKLGVKRVFCTPHIMSNLTKNSSANLTAHFNEKIARKYTHGDIEFRLAAEYMLDESFIDRLAGEKPLTYDGLHILVETSYLGRPINFDQMIFEIKSSGYYPILAHPERYVSFLSYNDFIELKQQGLKFQLNITSLAGVYGKEVKEIAKKLLLADLYDFIGTDIHSSRVVERIEKIVVDQKLIPIIKKLISNNNSLWAHK